MAPISSPQPPLQPPRVEFDPTFQTRQDNEHLQLLGIVCTIVGILTVLFFSIFLLQVGLGLAMVTGVIPPDSKGASPVPAGWIILAVSSPIVLCGWALGSATIYAGRCIRRREKRLFVQVLAGLQCLFMPIGTILGVFLLIVLNRPSVAVQFDLGVAPSSF